MALCTMKANAGNKAIAEMGEVALEGDSLKKKMSLMDIPKELFDHIFSKLSFNDLLRLRRVSKEMKDFAEDYLRLHVNSESFFKISFCVYEAKALSALLAFDFVAPFSKFHIDYIDLENVKDEMWSKIHEFLEIYGSKITHLKIDDTSIVIPIVSENVIRFFESLPNLEHLELSLFADLSEGRNGSNQLVQLIPSTFKCLRVLRISHYDCEESSVETAGLLWKFVEESSAQLETLGHPIISCKPEILSNLPGGRYGYVRRILEGPSQSHLKFYDLGMQFFDDVDPRSARDFYDLVTVCAKHDVKLLNVDASFIEEMMKLETQDKEEDGRKLSSVIVSLQHMHQSLFLLELPHLEHITLGGEGTSSICSMPRPYSFQRKAWRNLKDLYIMINSNYLMEDESGISVASFLDYFFLGIIREKMEDLGLEFYNEISRPPTMIDVSRSCPNLKSLFLLQWPGNNQQLSVLWTNLPLLEEVTLSSCKGFGTEAFVGNDPRNPAFLQANNLRSLTLTGLEEMPNITDRLFTQVLRHKPLRVLHLQSYKTIRRGKITVAGISSLLDGVFAETIERLGLKIKLKGVTAEELEELGKNFRSSKML